jgi:hypothetical protein
MQHLLWRKRFINTHSKVTIDILKIEMYLNPNLDRKFFLLQLGQNGLVHLQHFLPYKMVMLFLKCAIVLIFISTGKVKYMNTSCNIRMDTQIIEIYLDSCSY